MIEKLIAQYSEKGFNFAFRLCGNLEEARDLVQEACLRIFKSWDQYDASQPFDRYFLTILRHIYCDHFKRRGIQTVSLDAPKMGAEEFAAFGDRIADREEPVLDRMIRQETSQVVGRCLRGIGAEQRAILTLCDVEGLSYTQIAEVLDCPLGTVRSRICRARAALKEKLIVHFEEVSL